MTRLVADGGYLSGAGGAGIVLVDDHDRVIAARAVAFTAISSFEAEARAVWLASRMAEERGLGVLPVYNDNLDAIPWALSIGIDARELPFVAGDKRSRGPLHKLAHRLATRARRKPSGWRVDFEGCPPEKFFDSRFKEPRTPGPNAARALRARIASRIAVRRVEIGGASFNEARSAVRVEVRTERRQGRASLGGRPPGDNGYRAMFYDPTVASFDWWDAWVVTWREVALHHYYTATPGCYTPKRTG